MSSAEVFCCKYLLTLFKLINLSTEANSVDPVHTVQHGSTLFEQETSKTFRQTTFEPPHGISNNVVCVTGKASDQPAHMRSLIRAFASRLYII